MTEITPEVPNQRYGMQFQCCEGRGPLFHELPLAAGQAAMMDEM